MKKFLLSLAALISFGFSAAALTINADDLTLPGETIKDGFTITVVKGSGSSNPAFNTASGAGRIYAKNTVTISGEAVTKVVYNLASTNKNRYTTLTASEGTVTAQTADDTEIVWEGNTASVTFTVGEKATLGTDGASKAGQIHFTSITIEGTGSENVDPDPVDPDPTEPDPTEPTGNKVASIKALIDANNGSLPDGDTSTEEFILDFPVTVIYSKGANNYVTDGESNLLIYTDLKKSGLENGSVLPAGIKGKYQKYNKMVPELKNIDLSTVGEPTAGTPVAPVEVALDKASDAGISAYVQISGVAVSGVNGKNFTISAGTTTLDGYNTFGIGLSEGENLIITGFVNYYKDYQISPTQIVSASGKEKVEAPRFSPDEGAVYAGTKVTLFTNTADATIYYTSDGSEPTTASTLYTKAIRIEADVTLKALAVKEGFDDSSVATAVYTIKTPVGALFHFADPESLNPAYPDDKSDETLTADGTYGFYANVTGVDFTAGGVSIVNTKGTSTDARLYYQTSDKVQLRVYNGGSTVITSTDPAKNISKITFTYNNGSSSYSKVTVNDINEENGGTWVAAEGTWTGNKKAVTFAYSGTQQINAIEVILSEASAVDEVAADGADAAAEYYNLQGIRVENPTNGLYIKKQGSSVTKVIVK